MISYLINLMSPFFIAWFAAHFTPLQSLLDWIYEFIPDKLQLTRDYLNCFKCLAFWITLFMTFDPVLAMAFSMIAYSWTRWISNMKMML